MKVVEFSKGFLVVHDIRTAFWRVSEDKEAEYPYDLYVYFHSIAEHWHTSFKTKEDCIAKYKDILTAVELCNV